MATTDRCPNCGALVSPDAEWCGQCYEPLRREEAASVTSGAIGARRDRTTGAVETPGGGGLEFGEDHASWTCPVCGETNDLEASVCTICGTQFARLFVEPEEPPKLDPERAAIWSLVLPGLGHWKLGRKGDAVARFVLFGWSFGTLCVLIASRIGKGGLGATAGLFALFAGASFALYALSALDAYRIAKGEDPVVSTRMLLWGSAALVVLSTMIATLVTLPAARR
jgi:predicted RNA-binding Zn-ribbon protein involved in translation (DUF1610 family)